MQAPRCQKIPIFNDNVFIVNNIPRGSEYEFIGP